MQQSQVAIEVETGGHAGVGVDFAIRAAVVDLWLFLVCFCLLWLRLCCAYPAFVVVWGQGLGFRHLGLVFTMGPI